MTTDAAFKLSSSQEQAHLTLSAAYTACVKARKVEYLGVKAAEIADIARFLTSGHTEFGLLFCGLPGTGKTTMLHAVRQLIRLAARERLEILPARDFAEMAKSWDTFREVRRCRLLAIDDIGREPKELLDYGNILSPVADLMEYRYDKRLFTIATTNLTPKELTERYGERIGDRFAEMMHVVTFGGKSFRR